MALALRTLCGLSTEEVARALLVSEPTMAKRLTRARQKIRVAGIPYRVPSAHDLPERWDTVLATTYLLFNEGYAATAGPELTRPALVAEALRLTRLLHRLRPAGPGGHRAARADPAPGLAPRRPHRRRRRGRAAGRPGPHAAGTARRSPRRCRSWVRGCGCRPRHPDPYVVQAAIAACHALAPSWEETDWAAIESWYEVLLRVDDGPVVRLNHAVAVAEARGPQPGLDLVDAIDGLREYPLWHATRAALLRRLDRAERGRRGRRPRPQPAAQRGAARPARPLTGVLRRKTSLCLAITLCWNTHKQATVATVVGPHRAGCRAPTRVRDRLPFQRKAPRCPSSTT